MDMLSDEDLGELQFQLRIRGLLPGHAEVETMTVIVFVPTPEGPDKRHMAKFSKDIFIKDITQWLVEQSEGNLTADAFKLVHDGKTLKQKDSAANFINEDGVVQLNMKLSVRGGAASEGSLMSTSQFPRRAVIRGNATSHPAWLEGASIVSLAKCNLPTLLTLAKCMGIEVVVEFDGRRNVWLKPKRDQVAQLVLTHALTILRDLAAVDHGDVDDEADGDED
jgi:hypothetical protein